MHLYFVPLGLLGTIGILEEVKRVEDYSSNEEENRPSKYTGLERQQSTTEL